MKLTSENVNTVFKTCLADENGILVRGVYMTAYIDRDYLDEQRPNIASMASQLPEEFFDGGWTFLNMCIRKDHVQWTGKHEVCDKLLILAKAAGIAKQVLPEFTHLMPGGMPYYSFKHIKA